MDRSEKAISTFFNGFNCAQSVFAVFAPELGLDRNLALRVACAFGSGVTQRGEMCGAVSGALMAIGLKYGKDRPEDNRAKDKTYALAARFIERFCALDESIICCDLLGYDLSTPEGQQQAKDTGVFNTRCPRFVRHAVELLEEIL
jgi:C_GCAxxG_C_C family probable redox protein